MVEKYFTQSYSGYYIGYFEMNLVTTALIGSFRTSYTHKYVPIIYKENSLCTYMPIFWNRRIK